MVLRIAPDNAFAVGKINEALEEEKAAALKKRAAASVPPVEISLFASLSPSEMTELNSKIERHFYEPGGVVVNEGDTGKSLYVVKKGGLKVSTSVMGKAIDIGSLSEGDVFGEIAFLTGRPRTASVTASTEAEVIEIKEAVLQELIRRHPEIDNILRTFYESRVHDTVQKIKVELTPLEAA
jgi:cAMP-dependent protein kinase regulator